MKIIECEQRSPAWWLARRGIPTASDFHRIITPKTQKASAQQADFICELIAERNGFDVDGYVSEAMQDGIRLEDEARAVYSFSHDVDVDVVGFCLSECGRFGCSPDGLIGTDGGLELKCPTPKTQARYLLDGVLPAEYTCQVHGELLVTGRKWWDFMSYCPSMPTFVVRVTPDDFTAALGKELDLFCGKLAEAVAKIEGMRNEG